MSEQFENLKSITDPEYIKVCSGLYEACNAAKANMKVFPDTSISMSRKACELLTKLIYIKCVSKVLNDKEGQYITPFKMQSDPNFKDALVRMFGDYEADEILHDLHTLRKRGNAGIHSENIDPSATAQGNGTLTPIGDISDFEDIANACWFFGTDMSKNVTGTELIVDGGMSCQLYPQLLNELKRKAMEEE